MQNGATLHGPGVLYTIDAADRIVYVNMRVGDARKATRRERFLAEIDGVMP